MPRKARKTRKPAKSAKPTLSRASEHSTGPSKTSAKLEKQAAKIYVLFGADEYAKPRAAKFATEDAQVLAKAAASLHVRLVEVSNADLAEVATRLPAGRPHASGRGLVPYINGPLYLELVAAMLPDQDRPAGPDPTPKELPGSWDEIAPGHVVIVKESSECGWWDAVVTERTGDLVTVRYRDYPGCPAVVRHRSVVALISPPAP